MAKVVNQTNNEIVIVKNGYYYAFPQSEVVELNDLNTALITTILEVAVVAANILDPAQPLVATKTPRHVELDGEGSCLHTGIIAL